MLQNGYKVVQTEHFSMVLNCVLFKKNKKVDENNETVNPSFILSHPLYWDYP